MNIIKLPKKISAGGLAVLAEWLQTENQTIEKGQPLAKIETADAVVELQAETAGTVLKTMISAGCSIPADGRIAVIGNPGDDVEAALAQATDAPAGMVTAAAPSTVSAPTPTPATAPATEPAPTTPAAPPPVPSGDVIPILMPQAGQSMEEGTILNWKVKVGDVIEVGQPIVEIETDKANMEVEADQAGRVAKILAQEGEIVEIKVPIALLADNDADAEAFAAGGAETIPAAAPTPTAAAPEPTAPTEVPSGVYPILMPQAGQSMEEGTILGWKVKEGDQIEVGQVILEIETDKANMEVEADQAGRVAKIVAQEGEIVEIKIPIAYLADNDADVDAYISATGGGVAPTPAPAAPVAPAAPAAPAPTPTRPAAPAAPASRTKASPAARKVASQQGVDLKTVGTGSGPGGRILSTDIGSSAMTASGRVKASPAARKLAAERGINLAAIGTGSGPGGRILSTDVAMAKVTAVTPVVPEVTVDLDYAQIEADIAAGPQTIALTKMRKAIAKNLLWSKQNIPHFYAKRVVDADRLFATYRQTKQSFKCTVNDFVVRACAIAIREFPPFRSQYQNDTIVEIPHVNIGVAVGTDDGLLVPVVVDADLTDFQGLAEKTRTVVQNAREGKLDGVGQGIFTISNMGMFGTEEFSAIVNPPESAILAVGAIREDIAVKNGAIKPTRLMTMTVSVDHRVIDGALAAQFLNRLKELLEAPESLL